MNSQAKNILIVDDEDGIRKSLSTILAKEGYNTHEASDGKNAEKLIQKHDFALIISDLSMPGMNGFELLKSVKKDSPFIEFVLITGHGTIERAVEAMKAGAYDFITKPFKRAEFLPIVHKAIEKYNLSRENQFLREQLTNLENERHNFIGNSKQAMKIRTIVARVTNAPSSILISGESGTGKEVIARMVHYSGNKKDQPFVAVNCGAIPENLVESELFGHLKGSFTGAVKNKEGLFSAAGNGTLFLDEISTIPVSLQVKLLRALEEHEVRPVGSNLSVPVNARIIAATNRNLEDEIKENRFREDLYFRLNVIEIKIPPLRDRIDDLTLLITYFINRINKELNKKIKGVSIDAMHLLQNYSWPGNIRELENIMERAMIFCDGTLIDVEHLPAFFTSDTSVISAINLKDSLAEFEKKHIRSVLILTNGDKTEAARKLGIGVSSLYRKITELGIEEKS